MNKFKGVEDLFKKEKILILVDIIVYLIQSILSIYIVNLMSDLIDKVQYKDIDGFINMIPMAIAVVIVETIFFYLYRYLLVIGKSKISYNIRNKIGKKLVNISLETKEKNSSGQILGIYNNEIDLVENYFENILTIVVSPILFIIAVIYFVNINIKLFIAASIFIPVSSFLYNKVTKPIEVKNKELLKDKSKLNAVSKDILNGFDTIKAFNLQSYFLKRYNNILKNIVAKGKNIDKIDSNLARLRIALIFIPQLVIPLYGGYLSFTGEITIGQLLASTSIMQYIVNPVTSLLTVIKNKREVLPDFEHLNEIFNTLEEDKNSEAYKENLNEDLALEIKNLTFAYEKDKNILNNLSLMVNKKGNMKIIGQSGGGKSTLIKLILGFYKNYDGCIKLYGNDIKKTSLKDLREKISYVPQNPFIFKGTLEENITMGKNFPKKELINACKVAEIYEFIKKLNNGFNTLIGDGELKLSGGQRQRIAIARAVLKNGSIFILDEPTSALDAATENNISKELSKFLKDKASITITHKMNIIKKDDDVMVLDGGNLYEKV